MKKNCESDRTRTCDLCNVNATFYQLNYGFFPILLYFLALLFTTYFTTIM